MDVSPAKITVPPWWKPAGYSPLVRQLDNQWRRLDIFFGKSGWDLLLEPPIPVAAPPIYAGQDCLRLRKMKHPEEVNEKSNR
jgi:hypothetical protein